MSADAHASPALVCRGVRFAYDRQAVLDGVELEVAAAETVVVLGPSGAGKTTLLSVVAGFVPLAAGEVRIGATVVAGDRIHLPPERRDVGFVFQNYALWPHLSALETVAYPLRRRGLGGAEARRRARELLARVGVERLAERRPAELSGGEQQRVGLARALAREPRLYLFDEPTAHLDAALRAALAEEIAEQRRQSGAAAVHATHDAAEALAVADRVALLRDGRVAWVGTPREAYEEPPDLWAARLSGPAATLTVRLLDDAGDGRRLAIGEASFSLPAALEAQHGRLLEHGQRSDELLLLVRPEWAALGGPLHGTVRAVAYRGPHTDYRLATPAGDVLVREAAPPRLRPAEDVGWTLLRAWPLQPPQPPVDGSARSA